MLNIISQPANYILGRNAIYYKVGSSAYLAHIADFKILAYVQVYDLDSGTYSTIATLTGIPNVKNLTTISSTNYYWCTFDVKNVIMTYLKRLNPDYDDYRMEWITQFKVTFEEYFNGAASGVLAYGNIVQATPGGRSVLWMKSIDVIDKCITTAAGVNRLFITNKSNVINFHHTGKLFFAYNNYDLAMGGVRFINLEFTYNGSYYNYTWDNIPDADAGLNFARFVVDLQQIDFEDAFGITGFDWEKLTEFNVQVQNDGGAAFTKPMQVVMRNSFAYPVRHFYYRNDHGAIDYLPIFGKRTVNNDLTMQSAIVNADNSATLGTYGMLNAEKINYNELLKEEIEQATGYTSEAEFDLFTEFMLSDARWEMINRDGHLVWVPIQLVDSKFNGKSDRQSTWGQKFKFTYGIEEEFCR